MRKTLVLKGYRMHRQEYYVKRIMRVRCNNPTRDETCPATCECAFTATIRRVTGRARSLVNALCHLENVYIHNICVYVN